MADMREKLLKAAKMTVDEVDKVIARRGEDLSMEEWGELVDMYKDASEIWKNVHKVDYYEKK